MPIYAYRCATCGHQLDALQKFSEPALVDCPACGAAALVKQVTAAGFQLKGGGWYATDFRNGSTPAKEAGKAKEGDAKPDAKPAAADAPATESKTESKSDAPAPATPSTTPSAS
jgi:putative FmdB family regulatory protein